MAARLHKLRRFHGGVRLVDHKTESLWTPIETPPLPACLRVPLRQHIGGANEPLVQVGQHVLKGQVLAIARGTVSAPVHAPSSGTVTRLEVMPVPHVSSLPARCVEIETDGEDTWIEREAHTDFRSLSPATVCAIVHESGVVGLAGALFPTAIKLARQAIPTDTLIINAAECEPYISCDQALIAERAEAVVRGIAIAKYALQAPRVLIGIEDNKPASIRALREVLRQTVEVGDDTIQLVVTPTRYPTGGERQLIEVLTGLQVPSGGLPADIGVRVLNIATAYAMYRAVCLGEPLISRIVTVSGDGVARPANLEVLLGTAMAELIAHCGGYAEGVEQLTMGGPMMGFALPSDSLSVIKSSNCLLANTARDRPATGTERACIRCGACARACPAKLLPQQLYWYARARDLPKLERYNLVDCIECGACAHVCPSRIPLVQYYRYAKSELREQARNREQADAARSRFTARATRLAVQASEREAKMAKKRAALEASKRAVPKGVAANQAMAADAAKQDVIAAALARAQIKKAAAAPGNTELSGSAQSMRLKSTNPDATEDNGAV